MSITNPLLCSRPTGLTPIQTLEVESNPITVSTPKWVTSSKWRQCQHLEESFPPFDLLCRSVVTNHTQWDLFVTADNPFAYIGKPYTWPKDDPETTGKPEFSLGLS